MTVLTGFRGVVPHTLDHKGVQPATGPAVVAAQGLKYQQGPLQRATVLQCTVEREIEMESAIRSHPVHHEIARTVNSLIIDPANSDVRN